jgi:hypothetical protein
MVARRRGSKHFVDNRLTDGSEVVSLTRRPAFTPRRIPATDYYHRLNRPAVYTNSHFSLLVCSHLSSVSLYVVLT